MIVALAWIYLLIASPQRLDLVDEVYRIPANEWRYIEVGLKQRKGQVSARFETDPPSPDVRLALMVREHLERRRKGLPYRSMEVTDPAASGRLDFDVPAPGDYALVVDNQGSAPARVHLRVWVQFPTVTMLSPIRQFTVIVLSCAFFFGVVTFSARRLLRAVKH
jgi:hypothetical protein